MPFSFMQAQKFRVTNSQLFQQIKDILSQIIQIDPKGERDLITGAEALEVATGVIKLKSLAESDTTVNDFLAKKFGTFDGLDVGQQGQTLYAYLNGIDTHDCGATTIHVLLEPWSTIKAVI